VTVPTHRDELDTQIDRVASGITASAPRAGLRGRVLARLDERPPRAIGAWTAAATTAAAVVVIAISAALWPRQAPPTRVVTAEIPRLAPAPTAPESIASAPVATPSPVTRSAATSAEPAFVVSIVALPPIEHPEPITQESIQPERLSIPQLKKIDAIVIPPVDDGSDR
jgi:hypothetical protein